MSQVYYVYIHKRLDNNQIFYVGKGKNLRKDSHKNRNKHWHNIVNLHGFVSEILIDNIDNEFAMFIEQEVIQKYRTLGYALVNYTDGGEGVSGYKHTPESRQKMSKAHKGKSTWNKGLKFSDDAKQKMSEAHKGKSTWNKGKTGIYNNETKEKMRNKKLGLYSTYFWWTNGIVNTRAEHCPGDNWVKGRTKRGNSGIQQ